VASLAQASNGLEPTKDLLNALRFLQTTTPFSPSTMSALQAAADRLSPEIIRRRLDYWTLIVGPRFSQRERKIGHLSRFYAIAKSNTAATSSSTATFPSTSSSSAVARWACGA
jgi:hypothetical protein